MPQIKPRELHRFHTRLGDWYRAHGRHHLPWRQTDDPYRIWLSEVMLQQTQVSTVLARFYIPFLARFPTVESLARADRQAVMKAWEGLGYYRRAGFLHAAAKEACARRLLVTRVGRQAAPRSGRGKPREGGESPPSIQELLSLPGIGKNTAHAIAAFAYRQPVAILEANVKRVVARIFALQTPTEKELWAGAETLLNRAEPFDYNQAMMDLGSLICTPRAPDCAACPANGICMGQHAPEAYPAPKAKKSIPTRQVVIHVRQDRTGRHYLEQRSDALLGGLWGFPQSAREHALTPPTSQLLGTVTHIYSHFRLEGAVHHEKTRTRGNSSNWFTAEEIRALPLSKLDHKVLALVDKRHT